MRANTVGEATPRLNLLSRDQCDEMHFAVLEVLEWEGVNVFHEEARALLRRGVRAVTAGRDHAASRA